MSTTASPNVHPAEPPLGLEHRPMPSSDVNCDDAVSSALPVVKPATTGSEMSETSPPSRSAAMSIWTSATASASAAASCTRTALSPVALKARTGAPAHAAGIALCVRMHMIAVGPMMSCGDAPVSAYASGARRPVYRPCCAGSPAMAAYATASGAATAVTVSAALKSDQMSSRHRYEGSHRKMGR